MGYIPLSCYSMLIVISIKIDIWTCFSTPSQLADDLLWVCQENVKTCSSRWRELREAREREILHPMAVFPNLFQVAEHYWSFAGTQMIKTVTIIILSRNPVKKWWNICVLRNPGWNTLPFCVRLEKKPVELRTQTFHMSFAVTSQICWSNLLFYK